MLVYDYFKNPQLTGLWFFLSTGSSWSKDSGSKYNCSFKLFCKLIPIGEFIIPVSICLYVTDSFNTLAGTSPSLEQLLPFSYLLILSSETGSNLLTRLQNCLRWFFLRCWCDVYSKCLCHLSCSVDWWFQCCSLAVWY